MKKNNRGFTLVELLAVILLLSIIAAAVIPKTYTYVKDKEEGENTILEDKYVNAAKIHFAKQGIASIENNESVTTAELLSEGLVDNTNSCDNGVITISIDGSNIISYALNCNP
ncbi:MAG TPA: prepilin-type N-terminal cleavage/methylation domain-containing protein [Bacilli bacterium]|nr:prepilin-type N-terminal cleavage/methylation domain-containing protein [Bacilli bacterium]